MIDIERFVLASAVERNPLFKIHLMAMKLFGYMIFDDQTYWRLHCFRGVVLSISFVVFNIAQVDIQIVKKNFYTPVAIQ